MLAKNQEYLAFWKSLFYVHFRDFLREALKNSRKNLKLNLFCGKKKKLGNFCVFWTIFWDFLAFWKNLCWNCHCLKNMPGGRSIVRCPAGFSRKCRENGSGIDSRRGVPVEHILLDINDDDEEDDRMMWMMKMEMRINMIKDEDDKG